MKIFANIISILFNPILMMTYGVVMVVTETYLSVYPLRMRMLLVGTTFFITVLVPGLYILMLFLWGKASDLELTDRKERLRPYFIFIFTQILSVFLLKKIMIPEWFINIVYGSIVALVISMVINFAWKISAHALGIGGITGGVMALSLAAHQNPFYFFIILWVLAGLIGTARVILQKHTIGQVCAGFALGWICIFCGAIWNYYQIII